MSDFKNEEIDLTVSLKAEGLVDQLFWSLNEDQAAGLVKLLDDRIGSYQFSEQMYKHFKKVHKRFKKEEKF